jgi:hypothetical protein
MERREVLKLLAGASALPLLPRAAWAMFEQAQATAAASPALKVLSPEQDTTVLAIAEQIIPETDTPGAKAAGVDRFIDVMLSDWMEEDAKALFLQGLAEVDERSQAMFGKKFSAANSAQQIDLLKNLDDDLASLKLQPSVRRRERRKLTEKNFFYLMKRLTLVGYYTSQAGAQQALHYQIIPASPDMCAPLEEKESN